jgi:DNA-binding XRE family transcriptional regulator
MAESDYKPVPHNHEKFLERARERPGFSEAYDALEDEYKLARELLAARSRAGLTQEEVAIRMGTTKSAVSRLEGSGKHSPSLATLKKYAKAVGCDLEIRFVPRSSES